MTVLPPTESIRSGHPEIGEGVLRLRNRVDSCPRNEGRTPEIVEEERPERVHYPLWRARAGADRPLPRGRTASAGSD